MNSHTPKIKRMKGEKNYANENLYLKVLTYQIVSESVQKREEEVSRKVTTEWLTIVIWELFVIGEVEKMHANEREMMMILTGCKMILYLFDCESISCGENFYYAIAIERARRGGRKELKIICSDDDEQWE
jgi:hypothetical protein